MTTEYNGFTIKVFGIGEYTMQIIFESKLLLVKRTNYGGTGSGGPTVPLKNVTEGIQLGKHYIDNHREWLMGKYKHDGQNAVKRIKDKPYALPSSAGGKTPRRSGGDYLNN